MRFGVTLTSNNHVDITISKLAAAIMNQGLKGSEISEEDGKITVICNDPNGEVSKIKPALENIPIVRSVIWYE